MGDKEWHTKKWEEKKRKLRKKRKLLQETEKKKDR